MAGLPVRWTCQIEHVSVIRVRSAYVRQVHTQSLDQMKVALVGNWCNIPMQEMDILIWSMTRCVKIYPEVNGVHKLLRLFLKM